MGVYHILLHVTCYNVTTPRYAKLQKTPIPSRISDFQDPSFTTSRQHHHARNNDFSNKKSLNFELFLYLCT